MNDRFELISSQKVGSEMFGGSYSGLEIWRDKQTGVMYVCQTTHSGVGMSVLVDKDGKPMTTFKVNI